MGFFEDNDHPVDKQTKAFIDAICGLVRNPTKEFTNAVEELTQDFWYKKCGEYLKAHQKSDMHLITNYLESIAGDLKEIREKYRRND